MPILVASHVPVKELVGDDGDYRDCQPNPPMLDQSLTHRPSIRPFR